MPTNLKSLFDKLSCEEIIEARKHAERNYFLVYFTSDILVELIKVYMDEINEYYLDRIEG